MFVGALTVTKRTSSAKRYKLLEGSVSTQPQMAVSKFKKSSLPKFVIIYYTVTNYKDHYQAKTQPKLVTYLNFGYIQFIN